MQKEIEMVNIPLEHTCTFCGRLSNANFKVIGKQDPERNICELCIEQCVKVMLETDKEKWQKKLAALIKGE